MRPKKYPYSGRNKRQEILSPLFFTRPNFNEIPITGEVEVEFGVEVNTGRIYPEMIIHLDISGYGNRVHSVHRFPGTLLSVGESIQLKMLFYKRLRNFTTDRLLTFRESDWRFFIGEPGQRICTLKKPRHPLSQLIVIAKTIIPQKEIKSEQG